MNFLPHFVIYICTEYGDGTKIQVYPYSFAYNEARITRSPLSPPLARLHPVHAHPPHPTLALVSIEFRAVHVNYRKLEWVPPGDFIFAAAFAAAEAILMARAVPAVP